MQEKSVDVLTENKTNHKTAKMEKLSTKANEYPVM